MSLKKFLLTTFLTLVFYNLFRFIGKQIFSQADWWIGMNSDNWQHYQLGILLIFIAFIALKKKPFVKDLFLAIGSGMIIDESIDIFTLNPTFNHYSLLGIILKVLVFIGFVLITLKFKKNSL